VPGPSERDYAEKLQSQLILLRGALAAHRLTLAPQQQLLQPPEPELPKAAAGGRMYSAMHARAQRQQQQSKGSRASEKAKNEAAGEESEEEPEVDNQLIIQDIPFKLCIVAYQSQHGP
jgi:hypothetical protein